MVDTESNPELFPQALAQKENLDAIFNSLSDGILVLDNGLKITHANASAERITAYSKNELLGQSCTDILKGTLCGQACFMAETRDRLRERRELQIEVIRNDGAQRTLLLMTSLLHDTAGKSIGVVVVFRDQTELNRLKEDLKEKCSFCNIVGKNRRMLMVFKLIKQLAGMDCGIIADIPFVFVKEEETFCCEHCYLKSVSFKEACRRLDAAYCGTMEGLVADLDARGCETQRHSARVWPGAPVFWPRRWA